MRILPVQSNHSQVHAGQTAFRGLWGDDKTIFIGTKGNCRYHYDGTAGKTDVYRLEKEYYPFVDESEEKIAEVVKATENERETIMTDTYTKKTKTVVKVMERIPLAAETYSRYIKRELLSQAENLVEDTLKIAKLQKFLR